MECIIWILGILVVILSIKLLIKPVPQNLPKIVLEKTSERTYSAESIKAAYDKRIYSEDAVIEKLTTALLHKINTHTFPPKYIDLNTVVSALKHPWGADVFDYNDIAVLRKESTHQKLRNLGYKITIIPGAYCHIDDDGGHYDDVIKLEWN